MELKIITLLHKDDQERGEFCTFLGHTSYRRLYVGLDKTKVNTEKGILV